MIDEQERESGEPRVSIVIPAYNQSRFLAQTIRSALELLRHAPLEVVVVDDGSTDDTEAVARGFEDRPGFRYVRQENLGLSAARNRGLAESTGEFLIFLDSDDLLEPETIESLLPCLLEDDRLGFAYCDTRHIDEQGACIDDPYSVGDAREQTSGDLFDALLTGGYFPVHAALVRREALQRVGPFDTGLASHEDYDLWLRMSVHGYTARYVDQKLAIYRRHETSMSTDTSRMRESRQAVLAKLASLAPRRFSAGMLELQERDADRRCGAANTWHARNVGLERGGNYDFLANYEERRIVAGPRDGTEVWEATVGDTSRRGMLTQPGTIVQFDLDTGAAGSLEFEILLHPDTWDKPETQGGALFHVVADGRVAFQAILDPFDRPGDRTLHPYRLWLPANPDSPHQIVFKTEAVGTDRSFRWCMFCTPVFRWTEPRGEAALAAREPVEQTTG